MVLVSAVFFCAGILFGNLNALAMEPLGHIAGVAAGVVGSLTWLLAILLATAIGQQFDGTVVPLAAGFVTLSVALLLVMRWAEVDRGSLVRHS